MVGLVNGEFDGWTLRVIYREGFMGRIMLKMMTRLMNCDVYITNVRTGLKVFPYTEHVNHQ